MPRARVARLPRPRSATPSTTSTSRRPHVKLVVTARSSVEMLPMPPLPEALPLDAWAAVDAHARAASSGNSACRAGFAQPTPLLAQLDRGSASMRDADPLTFVRRITTAIFERFDYVPKSTRVDSPIDEALRGRARGCARTSPTS